MASPWSVRWTVWAHLPHDSDWSLKSYTKVMDVTYVEDLIALTHTLPSALLTSCMLFFMRQGISPIWEDPQNVKGGCYSYKVSNKHVPEAWREACYLVAGESVSADKTFVSKITGLSISPKKGFCILKIWMSDLSFSKPDKIDCSFLKHSECIFKRHKD